MVSPQDGFVVELLKDGDGAAIVRVTGDIETRTVDRLHDCIELAKSMSHRLIVDLTGVEFIGAAGLRSLDVVARSSDHSLVVVSPADSFLRSLLAVGGIAERCTQAASLEDAREIPAIDRVAGR